MKEETCKLFIGFDDTDSIEGGCTTSLAVEIIKELAKFNSEFLDFPYLIRLNPNIPFKTRGNGSVAIKVKIKDKDVINVKKKIISLVDKYSRVMDDNVNPGLVFINGEVPESVINSAKDSLFLLLSKNKISKILKENNIDFYQWNNGQGIVGAISAVTYSFQDKDYTFELLAYRDISAKGDRKIDLESIYKANEDYPETFSNLDTKNKRIMIIPKGKDPVFVGIRGETPNSVLNFWNALKPKEKIVNVMIFRTNQGTNAHVPKEYSSIIDVKPYMSTKLLGRIINEPETILGKHTRFLLEDNSGSIWCYAYEPTKKFRQKILKLAKKDEVEVFGGIRSAENEFPLCINIEYIKTINLIERISYKNPNCPQCGKSLTSKGKEKGFYCKKCKIKHPNMRKEKIVELPPFKNNEILLPPLCAHRHLTKPMKRYGKEKTQMKIYDYNKIIYDMLNNHKLN